jgi:hypothetical protein
MNSITKKAGYLIVCLLLSVSSFAVPADPDGTPDAPQAPIDSSIYILFIVGILFVAYYFSRGSKVRS